MDTTPAILILSPILLPIVQSIGMNPIHFGVVMIVNLAIGFVTPPIGVNLFVPAIKEDVYCEFKSGFAGTEPLKIVPF